MEEAQIWTPLGTACIRGDVCGIYTISISDDPIVKEKVPGSLAGACQQMRQYFAGERKHFDLELCPIGTMFQQKVWAALLEIPFGNIFSYMELAKKLGDPGAVRAVASANAQNPLWIVVPCHRVIGSDGSLKGYAGGLYRKKWLLNHESRSPQGSLFTAEQTVRSDG